MTGIIISNIVICILLVVTCFLRWKKEVITFIIETIEDAERLVELHGQPGVIKTRHILTALVFCILVAGAIDYEMFKTGEIHWTNAIALIIGFSALIYMQYQRNQANF